MFRGLAKKLGLPLALILVLMAALGTSFQSRPQPAISNAFLSRSQSLFLGRSREVIRFSTSTVLRAQQESDEDQFSDSTDDLIENSSESGSDNASENFDGKGFIGYLGPYILALFASLTVTAAFVKFVMLDS
jgi:hypothetical protein